MSDEDEDKDKDKPTDEADDASPPLAVSGEGRPVVEVKAAMRPVVLWVCPGCDTKSEGQGPAMVKYLVAGKQTGIRCHACGKEIILRIPTVKKVKPNIITPQQHATEMNRHQRRGLAKVNGGRKR